MNRKVDKNGRVCIPKEMLKQLEIENNDPVNIECAKGKIIITNPNEVDYKAALEKIEKYINNYDVFNEFSFPLMKRDVENQIKSSIKYEFDTSIKKHILEIINKTKENK